MRFIELVKLFLFKQRWSAIIEFKKVLEFNELEFKVQVVFTELFIFEAVRLEFQVVFMYFIEQVGFVRWKLVRQLTESQWHW